MASLRPPQSPPHPVTHTDTSSHPAFSVNTPKSPRSVDHSGSMRGESDGELIPYSPADIRVATKFSERNIGLHLATQGIFMCLAAIVRISPPMMQWSGHKKSPFLASPHVLTGLHPTSLHFLTQKASHVTKLICLSTTHQAALAIGTRHMYIPLVDSSVEEPLRNAHQI